AAAKDYANRAYAPVAVHRAARPSPPPVAALPATEVERVLGLVRARLERTAPHGGAPAQHAGAPDLRDPRRSRRQRHPAWARREGDDGALRAADVLRGD